VVPASVRRRLGRLGHEQAERAPTGGEKATRAPADAERSEQATREPTVDHRPPRRE
jgi:hypothetical protein